MFKQPYTLRKKIIQIFQRKNLDEFPVFASVCFSKLAITDYGHLYQSTNTSNNFIYCPFQTKNILRFLSREQKDTINYKIGRILKRKLQESTGHLLTNLILSSVKVCLATYWKLKSLMSGSLLHVILGERNVSIMLYTSTSFCWCLEQWICSPLKFGLLM